MDAAIDKHSKPRPTMTAEFESSTSCMAEININGLNSTQIAIVARMLDKYADQLYAIEQAAQQTQIPHSGLQIARGMPQPLRRNGA